MSAPPFADISHHQAKVDLKTYAKSHDRIVMKATEGTGYVDPTFASRWREAGSLGLHRVAYHFARAANNGATEFDHFYRTVTAAGLDSEDWLCLDAEDPATPSRAAAHAKEFTNRAVAAGRTYGLVYSGCWYADPNGLTPSVFPAGWRRLWISDYRSYYADDAIPLPKGWTRDQVAARQWTSTGTVPGIATPADYNRVLSDWYAHTEEDDMPSVDEIVTAMHADIAAMLADKYHIYLPPIHDRLKVLEDKIDTITDRLSALGADPAQPSA